MTSKNASAASEPATSLTDKEREAIAQMPYEEARDKLIQAVASISARHGEARANLWTENTRFAPICAHSRHLGEHLWTQRWRAETIYVPICVVTHRRSATHRSRTTRHPSSPDAYHNMTTSP